MPNHGNDTKPNERKEKGEYGKLVPRGVHDVVTFNGIRVGKSTHEPGTGAHRKAVASFIGYMSVSTRPR